MMTSRRAPGRPLVRRDPDGVECTAPSWESLTERLIREAQEEGRFDGLPGQGKPLHVDDDAYARDMALANHVLRNAGVAPPWIEADKEVRSARARIDALLARAGRSTPVHAERWERELAALADAHDDAVRRLEGIAPTPRQQRGLLDRERHRERLSAALAAGQDST